MYDDLKEKLKSKLYEKRYIHSLGVADEAKRLAALYGEDEDKAYLAGLLHDCAKNYTIEEQFALADKLNVELDNVMRDYPGLIHGFLGAVLAKTEYGIEDSKILSAIKYHTVGKAGMTTFEKIIYIADMTEANRDFDGVDKLRKAVNTSIDEAILISIEEQLTRFAKNRQAIHTNTVCMWNDIVSNKN